MVLCAGFGTRLRPLTDELPKPLMPIGDRPLLAHLYETLVRQGMRQVVVNTHHRANDFGNQIKIYAPDLQVLHEPKILGTAGGLSNAASALGVSDVVIWNGDPLSVYSAAETTFIDGEIFFDIKRDQAKRDQMAKERLALEAADRGRRPVVP